LSFRTAAFEAIRL